MTFICASIAVHCGDEFETAIERAAAAACKGAHLIEWRIDALAGEDGDFSTVAELVRRSPLPCIVACRPLEEGGEYRGDEQSRMSLFQTLAAADHPPRYIDIELAAFLRSMNIRQKVLLSVEHPDQPRDLATSLILSSHDFDARPRDLLQRVEAMTAEPACSVIKVAWHARSLRDNLEAFDLLRERRKPTIALCMGRFGLMSRVLAPKFGGFITFASDHPAEITAPGQPTIDELKNLYRFDRINLQTKVYGVIGWPVEHSLGPAIHNAGFESIGFDGVYLPLPVPGGPHEYEHFKATVGALIDHSGLNFRGASVTMPHKESLLRFVMERGGRTDPLTEIIGAANTLVVGSGGGLEALNTDASATVQALCAGMNIDERELKRKRAVILGAGGAARAVAAGLLRAGAHVFIANRTADRAARLSHDLACLVASAGASDGATIQSVALDSLRDTRFDILINCTPIGMQSGPAPPDQSPLPPDVPLDDSTTVMDTVYTPARTVLIQNAAARGARVITGLDMFLRQAAMQFEKWTSAPAPLDLFESLVTTDGRKDVQSEAGESPDSV